MILFLAITSSNVNAQLSHEYVVAQQDLLSVNPAAVNSLYFSQPLNSKYGLVSFRHQRRFVDNSEPATFSAVRYEQRAANWQASIGFFSEKLHIHQRNQGSLTLARVLESSYRQGRKTLLNFGVALNFGWNDINITDLRYADQNDPVNFGTTKSANTGGAVGLFYFKFHEKQTRYYGLSASGNWDSRYREHTFHYYFLAGQIYHLGKVGRENISIEGSIWARYSTVKKPDINDLTHFAPPPPTQSFILRLTAHDYSSTRRKNRSFTLGVGAGHYGSGQFRYRFFGSVIQVKHVAAFEIKKPWEVGFAYEHDSSSGLSFGGTFEASLTVPIRGLLPDKSKVNQTGIEFKPNRIYDD